MELNQLIDLLPEKIYLTGNYSDPLEVWIDYKGPEGGEILELKISKAVHNHSEQFSWGYGGSGPRQMALAILLEFLPFRLAARYSNEFKFKAIGGLPKGDLYEHVIMFRDTMRQIMEKKTETT